MRFKTFWEEQSGTDHGIMGYGKSSSVHKPSDGQPFKNLGSVAGQEPRPGGGGGGGGGEGMTGMFMKKKMKKMKKMKK